MALSGFSKNLRWADFREVENPPSDDQHHIAKIKARFSAGFRTNRRGRIIGNVSIQSSRSESWVVSGRKSAALLKHEQGHYDITAIGARDLLRNIENSSSLTQRRLNQMIGDIQTAINEYNRKYDRLTNHGLNSGPQRHWNTTIHNIKNNTSGTIQGLP